MYEEIHVVRVLCNSFVFAVSDECSLLSIKKVNEVPSHFNSLEWNPKRESMLKPSYFTIA